MSKIFKICKKFILKKKKLIYSTKKSSINSFYLKVLKKMKKKNETKPKIPLPTPTLIPLSAEEFLTKRGQKADFGIFDLEFLQNLQLAVRKVSNTQKMSKPNLLNKHDPFTYQIEYLEIRQTILILFNIDLIPICENEKEKRVISLFSSLFIGLFKLQKKYMIESEPIIYKLKKFSKKKKNPPKDPNERIIKMLYSHIEILLYLFKKISEASEEQEVAFELDVSKLKLGLFSFHPLEIILEKVKKNNKIFKIKNFSSASILLSALIKSTFDYIIDCIWQNNIYDKSRISSLLEDLLSMIFKQLLVQIETAVKKNPDASILLCFCFKHLVLDLFVFAQKVHFNHHVASRPSKNEDMKLLKSNSLFGFFKNFGELLKFFINKFDEILSSEKKNIEEYRMMLLQEAVYPHPRFFSLLYALKVLEIFMKGDFKKKINVVFLEGIIEDEQFNSTPDGFWSLSSFIKAKKIEKEISKKKIIKENKIKILQGEFENFESDLKRVELEDLIHNSGSFKNWTIYSLDKNSQEDVKMKMIEETRLIFFDSEYKLNQPMLHYYIAIANKQDNFPALTLDYLSDLKNELEKSKNLNVFEKYDLSIYIFFGALGCVAANKNTSFYNIIESIMCFWFDDHNLNLQFEAGKLRMTETDLNAFILELQLQLLFNLIKLTDDVLNNIRNIYFNLGNLLLPKILRFWERPHSQVNKIFCKSSYMKRMTRLLKTMIFCRDIAENLTNKKKTLHYEKTFCFVCFRFRRVFPGFEHCLFCFYKLVDVQKSPFGLGKGKVSEELVYFLINYLNVFENCLMVIFENEEDDDGNLDGWRWELRELLTFEMEWRHNSHEFNYLY